MSDQQVPSGKAFIGRDLRPFDGPSEQESPPLAPDSPSEEFRRQAAELLGPELRAQLGVGSADGVGLAGNQVYRRKGEVTWSAIDGEAVLLDLASGYYFSLNAVGTVIWEMLDGQHTLGSIHRAICARFTVDSESAWEDLAALVHRLCGEKLATLETESA